MGKEKKSAAVATVVREEPEITAELSLSKEDIIAIKVAELETALNQKKTQLRDALKSNEAEQKKTQKSIEEAVAAQVRDELHERADELGSSLKELGFRVDADYRFSFDADNINYVIQLTAKETKRKLREKTTGQLCKAGQLRHQKATVKLQSELEDLQTAHVELTDNMFEVRKRLQELPSTERQARAALAKTILNRTDRGKELLAELDGNLNLSLPMLDS